MLNKSYKKLVYLLALLSLGGCNYRYKSFDSIINGEVFGMAPKIENTPLRQAGSVVVCRSKQCAPAKLSMSSQYIYNSLLHLFENNNHKKALICQANPSSKTCLETYVTLPIKVGMTPAYMYLDSVKISDVILSKGSSTLNLLLNYNVTYNGQTPDCTPSQSILYVRNVNHILMEDAGYNCKMTTIGTTSVKTVFAIDYIDLDYGFIGGYYSIGLSGPAYGGGTGYMLLRLPKDAYPLKPSLMAPQTTKAKKAANYENIDVNVEVEETVDGSSADTRVKVFPIKK